MGIQPGKKFHIEYKGSKGDISERDIEIQKLAFVGNKLYLYAFCHLRHMVRSFLVSSIISMTYEGKQINDFQGLLATINSADDLINNLVKQALDDGN